MIADNYDSVVVVDSAKSSAQVLREEKDHHVQPASKQGTSIVHLKESVAFELPATIMLISKVNSKVLPYKDSLVTSSEYPYDSDAGRMYQARQISQPLNYGHATVPTYTHGASYLPTYRSQSYSDQFTPKHDIYVNAYTSEYNDDGSTFASGGPTYSSMTMEPMVIQSYGSSNGGRGWSSIPSKPDNTMYYDSAAVPAPTCNTSYQMPMQYSQPQYTLRPSVANDCGQSFSFSGMASSLPQPTSTVTTNDRVLPMPSGISSGPLRSENALLSLSRTAEAMGYNHVPQSIAIPDSTHQENDGQNMQAHHNTASNSFSSNMSYAMSTPAPDRLSESPDSDATPTGYTATTAGDMYTPPSSSDWSSTETIQGDNGLRSQGSRDDLNYYSTVPLDASTSVHRTSSQDNLAHASAAQPLGSHKDLHSTNTSAHDNHSGIHSQGLLAHGQQYMVTYTSDERQEHERRGSANASLLELNNHDSGLSMPAGRNGLGLDIMSSRGGQEGLEA